MNAARSGVLGVAGLAAALLVATTGWLHLGVVERARELSAAQGQLLAMAMAQAQRGPPDAEGLKSALEEHSDEGLRYVALLDAEGQPLLEAGEPQAGAGLPTREAPLLELEGRVRFLASPPPMPGGGPPGAPGGPEGPGGPGGPGGGPRLLLEYEPLAAADLRERSARALAVACAGAVVLVGAAAFSWRQQGRAEAAEREVSRHQHLAGLGQMSAVLAHEIRNPLAALKGHAQLLTELIAEGDRNRPRAERVVAEAERLERLTNDLLDFSRTAALERRPVDPAELAREAAEPHGERVRVEARGAPPRWSLDPLRLRQVLDNLLENALQADPGAVELSVDLEGGALRLRVRDHGAGVPPGEEEAIFEPFRTSRTRGTGLGLAVARRVVELHGGRIQASNPPDGGALFTVLLPEAP